MALLRFFLLNLLISLICATSTYADAATQAKPRCPWKCGNISIPFPFGIGRGCYRDEGFEITCNMSDYSDYRQIPYLGQSSNEVLELSLDHGVRINLLTTRRTYDKLNDGSESGVNISFSSTSPFTFSYTRNKFTAIGCDIYASLTNVNIQNYTSGCVSLCRDGEITESLINRSSCSGNIGCCQTNIPSGVKALDVQINSIDTQSRSWASKYDTQIAALHDGDLFSSIKFNGSDIMFPFSAGAVLDWAIGNETCEDARKNATSFACVTNSRCLNSSNGPGYRCNCSRGYQGNPYLPNGCQDIDECKMGTDYCKKEARCHNTDGGYYCECPPGTHGDGRTYGIGCSSGTKSFPVLVVTVGIGIGVALLILFATSFWFYRELKKRKHIKLKQKFFKQNGGSLLQQQIFSRQGGVEKTKIFMTDELERVTDNFNESRILGRGGSGTVYKGMLSDGRIVAIKKSKIVDESQIGQFINELVILSQINHRNVVKLLGCCLETEVPLLVYEFVSNGALSHHLHCDDNKFSISWENRLRIAREIASALSYLHSSASAPIFHRDIKSSNILLDENYRVKVADFGISRSLPSDKTHLTTLVQGTFGYLDPEYFHSNQFTEKSDVYSFGVVLVELLTGEKPISFTRSDDERNLTMHFLSSMKENRLFQVLDARVVNEGGKEELLIVAKLAKRCLKLVGKKRPTMKEVAAELEGLRRFQDHPSIPQNWQEPKSWVGEQSTLYMSGPISQDSIENTKVFPWS